MRNGDFAVEVVPHGNGRVRELESGQVLARPRQVYRLRLRNFGPLYCVAHVDIDGHAVTAGGLVLAPWSTSELERPVGEDDGRFTVIPEGDEHVFGPDGGRDDEQLGLIVASFRRELPRGDRRDRGFEPPIVAFPVPTTAPGRPVPDLPMPRRVPPPEWSPPLNALRSSAPPDIERAAGTGLTGHSDQAFVPFQLGPLEAEATVIQLRIVIGSEAALAEEPAHPLEEQHTPPRPAARP